jgi:hypothetical protein
MVQHKQQVCLGMFLLLVIAIWGPWVYDHDGVPPAELCHPPYFLLENGRCAGQVSGAFLLLIAVVFVPSIIFQFIMGTGALIEVLRGSLFTLIIVCLVGLPVLSTVLLERSAASPRRRIFHAVAWGVAAAIAVLIALSAEAFHPTHLWGAWLYALLALGTVVHERLCYRLAQIRIEPASMD